MGSPGVSFFERMLSRGEAVFDGPPDWLIAERPKIVSALEQAYATHRLNIAGPPLEFRAETAFAAAKFLVECCWSLAAGESKKLTLQTPCTIAADHLSADLCLRYLNTVLRRVRMRPPEEPLHKTVSDALLQWPLSGVVSDLEGPPVGDLSFFGHPGLQMLYAERLAARYRPAWLPPAGRAREVVELVFHQQGRPAPWPAEAAT